MAVRIFLSKKLGELRWTQADLARKTGIRAGTINEIYHELCYSIKIEHLDLICEALGCTLDEIMIYEPGPMKMLGNRTRRAKKNGND